jgi:uncharacterized membrane protein YdfJ with MMPL/SSD domain
MSNHIHCPFFQTVGHQLIIAVQFAMHSSVQLGRGFQNLLAKPGDAGGSNKGSKTKHHR